MVYRKRSKAVPGAVGVVPISAEGVCSALFGKPIRCVDGPPMLKKQEKVARSPRSSRFQHVFSDFQADVIRFQLISSDFNRFYAILCDVESVFEVPKKKNPIRKAEWTRAFALAACLWIGCDGAEAIGPTSQGRPPSLSQQCIDVTRSNSMTYSNGIHKYVYICVYMYIYIY